MVNAVGELLHKHLLTEDFWAADEARVAYDQGCPSPHSHCYDLSVSSSNAHVSHQPSEREQKFPLDAGTIATFPELEGLRGNVQEPPLAA